MYTTHNRCGIHLLSNAGMVCPPPWLSRRCRRDSGDSPDTTFLGPLRKLTIRVTPLTSWSIGVSMQLTAGTGRCGTEIVPSRRGDDCERRNLNSCFEGTKLLDHAYCGPFVSKLMAANLICCWLTGAGPSVDDLILLNRKKLLVVPPIGHRHRPFRPS